MDRPKELESQRSVEFPGSGTPRGVYSLDRICGHRHHCDPMHHISKRQQPGITNILMNSPAVPRGSKGRPPRMLILLSAWALGGAAFGEARRLAHPHRYA